MPTNTKQQTAQQLEVASYQQRLAAQTKQLRELDRTIREQQESINNAEIVVNAADELRDETMAITARRVAAVARQHIAQLQAQRTALVAQMESDLAAHQTEMKRLDALPPEAPLVNVVTQTAPQLTDTELLLAALGSINKALSRLLQELQQPEQQDKGAVWFQYFDADHYVIHSCCVIGWSGGKPMVYPPPLDPVTLAVVLPSGQVFNQTHGTFSSVNAYSIYLAQYYAAAGVAERPYDASTAYQPAAPENLPRVTPYNEVTPASVTSATTLTTAFDALLPPYLTNDERLAAAVVVNRFDTETTK